MSYKDSKIETKSSKKAEQIQALRLFVILFVLTLGLAMGIRWALFDPKSALRTNIEAIRTP